MSFLSKIKDFVGFTGLKVEHERPNLELPYNSTQFDFPYVLQAGHNLDITDIRQTVRVQRSGFDACIEELILADKMASKTAPENLHFPLAVEKGEQLHYPLNFEFDLAEALKKWNINSVEDALKADLKFEVLLQIDIKETFYSFDPEVRFILELKA